MKRSGAVSAWILSFVLQTANVALASNDTLAAGNTLLLSSSAEAQLNTSIELDWSGQAPVPLCGNFSFLGMSVSEAQESLSRCLKKFFKQTPAFELRLQTPRLFAVKAGWRNEKMSVVRTPQGTSVHSVLAALLPAPDESAVIRLISPFGLDIVLPAGATDWSKPFDWRGGETLIIEKASSDKNQLSIDILGEVKRPGKFDYKPSQSILSAIREAHGPTSAADQDAVVIFRTTSGRKIQTTWYDQATRIEPGDVVYVPSQKENALEKGVRWTGSILTLINTLFLILLARKG
jgi:protein involved in polysaccharide export with SLBB domain